MIDFLKKYLAPREIERVSSKYNKEIVVIDDHGKIRFLVGGLTQSGQYVEGVWKKAIRFLKKQRFPVKSCLILGLGGGTAANLVSQAWPDVSITGIDIDPEMVKLGQKYLSLSKRKNVQVIIGDVRKEIDKLKEKYDLILVDVYKGREVPSSLKTQLFTRKLFSRLNPNGTIVFNLLFYTDQTKREAQALIELIEKFAEVELLRELTNLLVVARPTLFHADRTI